MERRKVGRQTGRLSVLPCSRPAGGGHVPAIKRKTGQLLKQWVECNDVVGALGRLS